MSGTLTSVVGTDPITRQLFDETISALRQSINDLRSVVDSLDKRIEAGQKATHDAIMKSLDERLAEEKRTREQAIGKIEHDVAEIGKKQESRLGEIDGKLDALTGSMERIHGALDGWKQVMQSRETAYQENKQRIEKLENGHEAQERSLTILSSSQAAMSQDLRTLHQSIYGNKDTPDAPPSINRILTELGRDVRTGFTGQAAQIESIRDAQKDVQARLQLIEQAQAAQTQKWADRKAAVVHLVKSATGSKYFWAVAGVGVAGLVMAIAPETKDIILQIITTILGGNPQ